MRIFVLAIFLFLNFPAWALELTSLAFEDGKNIPIKYTCDSLDISPSLEWKGVPGGVQSFVIICDDPDAPYGEWVHWVIFNIPKEKRKLEENISKKGSLPGGIVQGLNDFGRVGYGGPCPPMGKPHRYYFKLYALDTTISLDENATKKDVLKAIEGHIIVETKLMGLYRRQ